MYQKSNVTRNEFELIEINVVGCAQKVEMRMRSVSPIIHLVEVLIITNQGYWLLMVKDVE